MSWVTAALALALAAGWGLRNQHAVAAAVVLTRKDTELDSLGWSGAERVQSGNRPVTDEAQKDLQIFCAVPNVSYNILCKPCCNSLMAHCCMNVLALLLVCSDVQCPIKPGMM